MENLSMKEMMEQTSFTAPKRNEVITGKVVMVKEDGIVVNIGGKADGILPMDEISNPENLPLEELYKVDDEIVVLVLKRDNGEGDVLLSSKRLRSRKDWELLEEKFNNKDTVTVKITEVVKGGLSAHYNDIRAFIPASHVDINFVRDLNQFVGEECEVEFLDFDRRRNQVVLSRKAVIEKDRKDELDEFWDELQVGQIREGVVRRFTSYGAFIDLGATDGLIHVSEIQWGKVNKPSDVLKANESLDFMVLDFNRDNNKISLSRKALTPDPWEVIDEMYQIGENYDGKIVSLTDFGAFVDVGGIDGLIHISDISWRRIKHPSDVLTVGDEIEVKVLRANKEKNRISLGLKQLTKKPFELFMENNNVGDIVTGEVVNLLDFGAFVRLEEGVEGLVHVSQISYEHVEKPSDELNIGDKIQVKILDINPETKRIALSIKETLEKPEMPEKPAPKKVSKPKEEKIPEYENQELEHNLGEILDAELNKNTEE